MTNLNTLRIRELNDLLRTTGHDGHIHITRGIATLTGYALPSILNAVRSFSDFTPDNDPHGEHDFGSVTVAGHHVFWKIDYYAPNIDGELDCDGRASEDPSNPDKTIRVLTIMLAEEY
ncbi:DUF3768 domain-containing protein (plasmid) [Labrenzia sp. 5N]|uniref:DUF3768 domain-containing protein n=1 Tax=Labrenzia sp. 5N TaxID=2723402 RepID=UPI0014469D23|nr:DUF3768 domain-containing protein [Labrenzia sp. 5N]NKX68277.1 DUF3768 domain-containing protein [Labrenzia sp. 5N]